jgi:hypothetical protein
MKDFEIVVFRFRRLDDRHPARLVARLRPGGSRPVPVATHKPRHPLQRLDRGGQRDALELTGEKRQALDSGRQMGAALARGHGMNLIENDRLEIAQQRSAPLRSEQDVQRLGRRDQHLGGVTRHSLPLPRWGVAAPGEHADRLGRMPGVGKDPLEIAERTQEIALDVVVQSPQRRDIEYPHPAARPGAGQELVQRPEEGRKRLAAAGGRGDQDMITDRNPRP